MPQTSAYSLKSLQLNLPDIGLVLLQRSAKAKRISIRLQPLKGIRVVVPPRATFEEAQKFLESKLDWIKLHLPKIEKQETNLTVFRPDENYYTFSHQLRLLPHDKATLKARLNASEIQVFYPAYRNSSDDEVQQFIRKALEETYRVEAKQYLPTRVDYFARQFGFSYQKVVIKKAGTRWGSCSYQNNINLNLHLMRLPAHLRDYVILHELAHTVEKNHGPRFWALLDKISGNAVGLDKEIKNYRIELY
ncbi:MAG: M48 family metallopeptidase [Adhaeribacter sp.]